MGGRERWQRSRRCPRELLALRPTQLAVREAAALPLIFITAWEGLVDRAAVKAGQKVLVLGAGGVGQIAIQLARALGAEVFAPVSWSKAAFVARLGATAIESQNVTVEQYVAAHAAGRGFDVVYSTSGGASLDVAFRAVRRYGHVVSCLGWGQRSLSPLSKRGATYSGVFTLLPLLTGEGLRASRRHSPRSIEAHRTGQTPRRRGSAAVHTSYGFASVRCRVKTHQVKGKIVVDIVDS